MDDLDRLKEELFKDPEFKAEYDAHEPEYELIRQMITARAEKNMTQKELAEKIEALANQSQRDFAKQVRFMLLQYMELIERK